ncbi:MAG TPA: tetratricopeptide repeat protein [Gemmatimonadaceae bacterium]
MSNSAKLKKKAADYEAKKQFDKALEVYEAVLNTARAGDEERDVPLYNRVGDLHYRLGNNEQAINYYEKAADLYAEGGFFNNAIALCNKILRYSPGRTIVYYKLGMISAKKGFTSDAKQNFLEYADRMQRQGKMDEAFRALKEFADLCPGQDDVRLMLADQLAKAERKPEALEQLELLYDTLEAEGRSGEANATLERMKNLDPTFKPRRSITPTPRKKEGLVFLDLDFDSPSPADAPVDAPPAAPPKRKTPVVEKPAEIPSEFVEAARPAVPEGLELTSLSDEPPGADVPAAPSSDLVFLTPAEEEPPTVSEIAPIDLAPVVDAPAPEVEAPVTVDLEEAVEKEDSYASNGSGDEEFIDLGEWLERNRTPSSTRMIAHDEEPEDNEQKDFGEMLDKFKAGISRNVDDEDFESHYDLGIAFREMGLLDEAIGSFQKAARGPDQLVRASEAIGQCFMDKGEAGVTVTVLERLVRAEGLPDNQLVGVLYLLGRAAESLSREEEAATYYQRVLAVQIGFRDAADRLSSLAQASR